MNITKSVYVDSIGKEITNNNTEVIISENFGETLTMKSEYIDDLIEALKAVK